MRAGKGAGQIRPLIEWQTSQHHSLQTTPGGCPGHAFILAQNLDVAPVDQAEMMWTKIAERAERMTREREQCSSGAGGDNAVVAADRPTTDDVNAVGSGSLGGSVGAGVAAAVAAAAATRGPYYLWTDFGKSDMGGYVRLKENVGR